MEYHVETERVQEDYPIWKLSIYGIGLDPIVGYFYSDEVEQFDTTIYPTFEAAREALMAYVDHLFSEESDYDQ